MTQIQRFEYGSAVVLVVALALYNGFWLGLDIGVRLDLIDRTVFGIDVREFTLALSLWNEIFFGISAIASFLAAGFVLRRSRWTVWAFGGMLAAGIADWIMLIGNAYYDGSGSGFLSTGVALGTMGLLLALRAQQILR